MNLNEVVKFVGGFSNLTISTPNNSFVLSGTATANLTGSVGFVFTNVDICPPTTAPSSCNGTGTAFSFTTKQVTPEIPVSAGQIVQVQVVVTFS